MRKVNEEVRYVDEPIVNVTKETVEFLKSEAGRNERRRVRLCAHRDVNEPVHEMLIVHAKDTYVRPHKHLDKSESFHVVEGLVDVVVFDDSGSIIEVVKMGDYHSGRCFYFRIADPFFHTIVIESESLVFHETTKGPFKRSETLFADWAPDEEDAKGAAGFLADLKTRVIRAK